MPAGSALRRGRRAWFSEIGELLHLLLTTVWMPVPLTNGPLVTPVTATASVLVTT